MENEVIRYEGGGVREAATHKGTYRTMPMIALTRLSHRYQYGELKYGASDNYKAGLPISNCWDSAMRHLVAYASGDNSEDHLAAVAWNVFAMMHNEIYHPEFQDFQTRVGIPISSLVPEHYQKIAAENAEKGHLK